MTGIGLLYAGGRGTFGAAPACGRVPDDVLDGALQMRGLRSLSRTARLAMVACVDALGSAGLPVAAGRCAVVLGTRWASVDPLASFVQVAAEQGAGRVFPMAFPNTVTSVHAGHLAALLGPTGPNLTLCGPDAGLDALTEAARLLLTGRSDAALAVGADALDPTVLAGLAPDSPTPGEAAVALLLERAPSRPVLFEVTDPAAASVTALTGHCQAADGLLALLHAATRRTGRDDDALSGRLAETARPARQPERHYPRR